MVCIPHAIQVRLVFCMFAPLWRIWYDYVWFWRAKLEFVCEFAFTSLVCSCGSFYGLAFLTLWWYSAGFGAVIIWIWYNKWFLPRFCIEMHVSFVFGEITLLLWCEAVCNLEIAFGCVSEVTFNFTFWLCRQETYVRESKIPEQQLRHFGSCGWWKGSFLCCKCFVFSL